MNKVVTLVLIGIILVSQFPAGLCIIDAFPSDPDVEDTETGETTESVQTIINCAYPSSFFGAVVFVIGGGALILLEE